VNSVRVYLEIGKKRVFAAALDWPGWCRSGRDEAAALKALVGYAPRYARVVSGTALSFEPPADDTVLDVVERLPGDATTDFGAPGAVPAADTRPFGAPELERSRMLLEGSWRAFDTAVEAAIGRELRRGPRGGGRDLEQIVRHVLGSEQGYLSALGWRLRLGDTTELRDEIAQTREAMLRALSAAAHGELPERGPRGGTHWPALYFVRRVLWHRLDHLWEIEDRVIEG
jgi:hypothetical protein